MLGSHAKGPKKKSQKTCAESAADRQANKEKSGVEEASRNLRVSGSREQDRREQMVDVNEYAA